MITHRLVAPGAALLAAICLGCSDDPTEPTAGATEFTATLNGANERPNPVTTAATGSATFTLSGSTLTYSLTATGMTNVTAAHIHIGRSSVAGGILVTLLPTAPPAGPFSGTLATGTFTEADLSTSPLTLASLVTLMRNSDVYVNVHTQANPGGEIRGQLAPR